MVLGACAPSAPDLHEVTVTAAAWPAEIRALDPVSVYTHNMNTVAVLKLVDGIEYGKYIARPESSYWPQSGDDGFTFMSDPSEAAEFGVGCKVYEFRRERE